MPFQKGYRRPSIRKDSNQEKLKPSHPEENQMRPVADYRDKVQVMLRVDIDKIQELRKKNKVDGMTRQGMWERIVDLYIDDNYQLMKLLEPCKRKKRGHAVNEKDQKRIEKQLELESPLQDLVIEHDPFDKD